VTEHGGPPALGVPRAVSVAVDAAGLSELLLAPSGSATAPA